MNDMELMTIDYATPAPVYQNTTLANPAQWFVEYLTGRESDAGPRINNNTALTYSTIWNAVTMIAGDISCVPCNFYRKTDEGREEYDTHPSYWLLNGQADRDQMTGRLLRETMQAHALLFGNGYAVIEWNGRREPARLILRLPNKMEAKRDNPRSPVHYEYTDDDGKTIKYDANEVLHLRGLGWDGIKGYSVLTMARNSFGLGLAQEKHGSGHFKNGARPGIVVAMKHMPDQTKVDKFTADWEKRHTGAENAGRVAVLGGEDLKITPIPISNEDSQWIESREFQREEIAAWFRVPLSRLGSDKHTSYNSLEVQERVYYNMTLRYWFNIWEDEIYAKLVAMRDWKMRRVLVEHNVSKLFEADTATKTETLSRQIESKMRTPNEARKEINLPPHPDGDRLENPNTSSGADGEMDDDEPAPDPTEETGDDTDAQNFRASIHKFISRHFVGINSRERRTVIANAKKQTNFVEWLELFYNEKWPFELARGMEPVCDLISETTTCAVAPSEAAAELARQSKEQILQISGYSMDGAQLVENVTEFMDNWPEKRAKTMADLLVGA